MKITLKYGTVTLLRKSGRITVILIIATLVAAHILFGWLSFYQGHNKNSVLSAFIDLSNTQPTIVPRDTPTPTIVSRPTFTPTPIPAREASAPTPIPVQREIATPTSLPAAAGSLPSPTPTSKPILINPGGTTNKNGTIQSENQPANGSETSPTPGISKEVPVKLTANTAPAAITLELPITVSKISLQEKDSKAVYVVEGKRSGRLLGLIPISINSQIEVNPKDQSIIFDNKPWWSFLILFETKKLADTFTPNVCGNKVCELAENSTNCPKDCGPFVSNVCGNKVCEPGENPTNCKQDCCGFCGDNKCVGYACGENPTTCPADCGNACGDGVCSPGENPQNCPYDCSTKACGNGKCEVGENPTVCPSDCGTACGDGICGKGEDYKTCPVDCGYSGDGICSANENTLSSSKDCTVSCGDGKCQFPENNTNCPQDCSVSALSDKGICGDGICDKKDLKEGC
ncbi:MAG: hypothetical protein ACHQT7_02530, partial [Candidatus Levyibacteriota bacterium]